MFFSHGRAAVPAVATCASIHIYRQQQQQQQCMRTMIFNIRTREAPAAEACILLCFLAVCNIGVPDCCCSIAAVLMYHTGCMVACHINRITDKIYFEVTYIPEDSCYPYVQ